MTKEQLEAILDKHNRVTWFRKDGGGQNIAKSLNILHAFFKLCPEMTVFVSY